MLLNAGLTQAARMLGIRNDPYLSVNFLVEIDGLVVGGFQEVTGLQVETEVEDYREGGVNEYVHRLAGPTRYPSNLVLKKGLTDVESLWKWHQQVVRGDVRRRNGSVYLLDRKGLPAMWWNFTGAYPVKWSGPDLRAEQGAVAVEQLELVHRGLSKPWLSSFLSAARGLAGAALDVAG
ncbi:MAG TPA: phage tail protein [Longimicrobiaceae bacterium]|nr:phage tail protein [Longimicrobiaceae bacterium]